MGRCVLRNYQDSESHQSRSVILSWQKFTSFLWKTPSNCCVKMLWESTNRPEDLSERQPVLQIGYLSLARLLVSSMQIIRRFFMLILFPELIV